MNSIKHLLYDYLVSVGLTETTSKYLNMLELLIALFILVFIIDFITRKLLVQLFTQFASKSKTNFDDLLGFIVQYTTVGQTVNLQILRNSQVQILPLTLQARP